jgi:lipid A 3-O-deacylase PagL
MQLLTGGTLAGQAAVMQKGPVDAVPAPPDPGRDARAPNLGIWLAGARHSAFRSGFGDAYRDFVFLAVRRAWPLGGSGLIAVDYVADLIPAALSSRVSGSRDVFIPCPNPGPCVAPLTQVPVTQTVYGVGLVPLGVQARLFRGRAVQGLVEVSGGALWFARPLPGPSGTRFNFTAQIGAGLQIRIARRTALLAQYHYHHTSNAGTGAVNPGLNSFVFSLGLMRTR